MTTSFDRLKAQLASALDAPFPSTPSEGIEALEGHLRATIGEGDEGSGTTSLALDPAHLTPYIEFVKEAVILAHQRRTSGTLESASACHDAGVTGVLLISAGTGLHPGLGVLGFAIGVYLLLDACS